MTPRSLLHFSDLKHIARSPAHYRAHLLYPPEPTAAMRFGTLVHAKLLGHAGKIVAYPGTRRGREWEAFEAEHEGALIVKPDELELADACALAVHDDPVAGRLLDADREVPLTWKVHGRECATRGVDLICPAFIGELKTCTSAEPAAFRRDAARMAYHAQLAWYKEGAELNGRFPERAYIIAVERKYPHAVTVFELTDQDLLAGEKLVTTWVTRLLECEASDQWPAYRQTPEPLGIYEPAELQWEET